MELAPEPGAGPELHLFLIGPTGVGKTWLARAFAQTQGPACIEDIDYRAPRGLDRQLVRSLTAESAWVRESAATVTPRSSSKPRNCFATSLKRGPMAAMVS